MTGGRPLADAYDLFIFDLDGVVYLGEQPVPGAVAALTGLHERGRAVAYATNNASRRADTIAALLKSLGVPAEPAEVITSAQATAAVLAQRLPAGSPVLVVGAEALAAELADVGLCPVFSADERPVAVAQGYGPLVGWAQLAEGCLAVRAGAVWVATNADTTLASPRGPVPGNGALVAALVTALDRQPDLVVGKPAPGLFEQAALRTGARRPLVVGDRLDTDIEGASRAGMDSLLVLTGVTRPAQLLAVPPPLRPTYLATDLSGLFEVDDAARITSGHGGWRIRSQPTGATLAGSGDAVDALRALCAAAWSTDAPRAGPVRAHGPAAAAALQELGIG